MKSKFILGTVQLGINYGINNMVGKPSINDSLNILSQAQKAGIHVLDTADAYGSAYDIISKFNAENEPFKVITKFAYHEGQDIVEHIKNVLDKLRIDVIDTLLFHKYSDIVNYPLLENAIKELKVKGYIKDTGVSIYLNDEFKHAIELDFVDTIQLPFNLLDNFSKKGELIQQAKAKNKNIHARSIYLQGLFFKPLETLPLYLSPLKVYLKKLESIAQEHNITIQQMALNYVLQNKMIDHVLFGVETLDQLNENILASEAPFDDRIPAEIDEINVIEEHLLNPVNWKFN